MRIIHKYIQRLKNRITVELFSMSQAGQDYWVYGEVFNEMEDGFFLDIGAHNGRHLSNTYILENRYNWSGLCIEANPITYQKLKKNRNCLCLNRCVDSQNGHVKFALRGVMGGIVNPGDDIDRLKNAKIIEVETQSLEKILIEANTPKTIDYMSIDIEGSEDRALLDFPFDSYLFKSITIERPSEKLRSILRDYNYILIKEIPKLDCFYIHRSFLTNYQVNLLGFSKKKFTLKRLS